MRLTKRDESFCFDGSGCNLKYVGTKPLNIDINEENIDFIESFINKLGQLEDIEDELGIDLITLFKAIKNGIYYKYKYGYEYRISKCRKCYLSDKKTLVVDYHTYKYLCDYGKTWAITREELL